MKRAYHRARRFRELGLPKTGTDDCAPRPSSAGVGVADRARSRCGWRSELGGAGDALLQCSGERLRGASLFP